MSTNDDQKRAAAEAAYEYVRPRATIGVGTGSTVNHFIDVLAERRADLAACVSSSTATTERLKKARFDVIDLNSAGPLELYVDGADEVNARLELVKGGGGALTREKVLASAARNFVCLVDPSKRVELLGRAFPLPVEVLDMARSTIARELVKLGGDPALRKDFLTDNGHRILDVRGLDILNPD